MPEAISSNEQCLNTSIFITRHGCRLAFFSAWCLFVLSMICGCGGDENHNMDEKVLVRVGGSVVTVRAFYEAFESGITSPSRLFQDSEALRDEKYRVLNRLSEELLILERARELNLQVSDEESAQVVDNFKKDFPDDTFEKTLMENGISFLTWKKALNRRLLMEKVIRQDLSECAFRAPLTVNENGWTGDMHPHPESETMGVDLQSPPENDAVNADDSEDETPLDDKDLSGTQTKTIAAEAEYPDWIKHLKQQYAIEIDWKLWETIEREQADDA